MLLAVAVVGGDIPFPPVVASPLPEPLATLTATALEKCEVAFLMTWTTPFSQLGFFKVGHFLFFGGHGLLLRTRKTGLFGL
jgi:hypothetical protein